MIEEPRRVYLDNASTTPIAPEVIEEMMPYFATYYGNPSSIHSHGRKAKSALEQARKTIAQCMGVTPAEIIFTSGGTEADNMALRLAVQNLGVKHIITSPIEHHAVLNTAIDLQINGLVSVHLLTIDEKGNVDLSQLPSLLQSYPNALVSLMHANNEIGNIIDLMEVAHICQQHNAFFHSDTVQTMGNLPLDFSQLNVDFAVGAAHKFNGPKGVGFLYVNKRCKLTSFITGGGQERSHRAGTENLPGIVGMAKALQLACDELELKATKLSHLKKELISGVLAQIPGAHVNGDPDNSLFTVANIAFPPVIPQDIFLFQLDLKGISISGGSACSSGSAKMSHVLSHLPGFDKHNHIRFSFGKYSQLDDVHFVIQVLKDLYAGVVNVG